MTQRQPPINRWTPLEEREPNYRPRRAHVERRPVQKLPAITTNALPVARPIGQPVARPISPTIDVPNVKRRGLGSGLMAIGTGMLAMSILYFVAVSYVLPTVQAMRDHWTYGEQGLVRVYGVFGHGDSPGHPTELIADTFQGHIQIVDIPAGLASKARLFQSSYVGNGIVIVELVDMNGDGKMDVVAHVEGSSIGFVLYNTGKSFQLQRP